MTRRTIDLNADLGEGFPDDVLLLDRVSSASIACLGHAGDRSTVLEVLREARKKGVIIGAHPGFADRDNFGRREQTLSAADVCALIRQQFATLASLAAEANTPIRYVKPHGALYNQAQYQGEIAQGVVAALLALDLPLLGQPGTVLEAQAVCMGVSYVSEGFPDRRYRADGRLIPRNEPGALLHDPGDVEAQVVRLIDRGVSSLCIHGDDPRAVAHADLVRAILLRRQIAVKSFAMI